MRQSRQWRYAYNTNGLAHHRLADAVDLLADLGYEGIALTPDVGHLDPATATAREAEAFGAHASRRGLAVTVQTGARFALDPRRKHQPTLLDPEAGERRRRFDFLVRCLDLGRDAGARVLSFWSGRAPHGASDGELTARLAAETERLADAAAVRGMTVALEPEPGMWIARVDEWLRFRERVPHPALRLALDVGHVHCNREGSPAGIVLSVAGDLGDVQVEDMREDEHLHLPFGEGTLDIAPPLLALRDAGYAGPVVVELSRDSHRAAEVASAALQHLRRIVP